MRHGLIERVQNPEGERAAWYPGHFHARTLLGEIAGVNLIGIKFGMRELAPRVDVRHG